MSGYDRVPHHYRGGPLDGQEAHPRRGQWSIRRKADGTTMKSSSYGTMRHGPNYYLQNGDYVWGPDLNAAMQLANEMREAARG
jgi:hypothetical protein